MQGLPTSCGYRVWKPQGRVLAAVKKWHPNPKGVNENWNPEGELERDAPRWGTVTIRLRVAASHRCPAGREAGRPISRPCFSTPRDLLLGLPSGRSQTEAKEQEMPLVESTWVSLFGQRAGWRVRCGCTEANENYLAQKRFVSYSQGHFKLGWHFKKEREKQ